MWVGRREVGALRFSEGGQEGIPKVVVALEVCEWGARMSWRGGKVVTVELW